MCSGPGTAGKTQSALRPPGRQRAPRAPHMMRRARAPALAAALLLALLAQKRPPGALAPARPASWQGLRCARGPRRGAFGGPGGRGGVGYVGVEVVASRRAPRRPPPTADEQLLWALGCELWAAGSDGELGGPHWQRRPPVPGGGAQPGEGCTSHLPTALRNAGCSIQDAADSMLDRRWGAAWRQLENASTTCREYWPAGAFEGLVNLVFCQAEDLPSLEKRAAASESLEKLAAGLANAMEQVELNNDLRFPYRERGVVLLRSAGELLQEGAEVLRAGKFHAYRDPRGKRAEEDRDIHGWYDGDPDPEAESDEDYAEYDAASFSSSSAEPGSGSYAAMRISEIRDQLERANVGGPKARRALLRRLVRECHPDQNPGRESDVLPVFNYVLRMLRVSTGIPRAGT
ncbi:unnamed protein product [Prorocentrum cordatum]|uniref:J domain-containing protein n=1 Tax=Prorocentrum cordatum TaxID=2364126 RepID=A0ABN9PX21_9DINO|nr:unnamed protein product [Polarella glacialis]